MIEYPRERLRQKETAKLRIGEPSLTYPQAERTEVQTTTDSSVISESLP